MITSFMDKKMLKDSQLRAIFNSLGDAIFIHDKKGRIIEINNVVCKNLGYSKEELVGMNIKELDIENSKWIEDRIDELIEKGNIMFESAHKSKDGNIIPVEINSQLIELTGETLVLSIARDITKRVRYEYLIKRFVSTVSHELRTPISVLVQSMNNLEKYKNQLNDETKEKLMNVMSKNISLISKLIEEISIIFEIDKKDLTLKIQKIKPKDIFNEIIGEFETRRTKKNILFDLYFDKNVYIYADRKKINRIFKILIDNALKYSNKDSTIKILLRDNYMGEYNPNKKEGILFQVIDEGNGIKESDLPYIFECFYKSDDVTKSGAGLGLFIAKNLIELHNGRIFVFSTYGKGTTISIFLPKNKYFLEL
ncbi:MAG: PAS domain S-box protein [Promethearchaeota archaeon]|nr:MAG: PAS domain S-box protein [Candidatus Lokiarchaeota archaeon]